MIWSCHTGCVSITRSSDCSAAPCSTAGRYGPVSTTGAASSPGGGASESRSAPSGSYGCATRVAPRVIGRPAPRRTACNSESNTSRAIPAASAARARYRSRVIGSLAARIVGNSRSSARRLCWRSLNQPARCSNCTLRSNTSIACSISGSIPARPLARVNVSGSSPSGSVTTRTSIPLASSTSAARNVAFCPGPSESYSRTTCFVKRANSSACCSVSAVPIGATTCSIPASTSRNTSK